MANRNRNDGSALTEFVVVFPMLCLFWCGSMELVRILAFKAFLEVVCYNIAADLSMSELAFERAGLLKAGEETSTELSANRQIALEKKIGKFIGIFPTQSFSSVSEKNHPFFRIYVEKNPAKFASGIRVHINACLKYLTLSLTVPKSPRENRDCLGQFLPQELGTASVAFASNIRVHAAAFVPRMVSYEVWKYGLPESENIIGINTTPADVIAGAEQLHDNSLSRTKRSLAAPAMMLGDVAQQIFAEEGR